MATDGPATAASGGRIDQVRACLAAAGLDSRVVTFAETTRTASDAAVAIGCTVGQIAKSLIFRTKRSERPVLVIASGVNRVNEKALTDRLGEAASGERIVRADADFVRRTTGFAIGGVPPIGHGVVMLTLFDRDLLAHDVVWAAAGTPHAVFAIAPADLARLSGAVVGPVT